MKIPSLLLLTLGLSTGLAAQTTGNLIYYPFLAGKGTAVLNLWAGTGSPLLNGTLTSTNTTNTGWATGRTGSALSGKDAAATSVFVDTKLNQGTGTSLFTGSFTVAFFIKERWPQTSANTLAYFFSGVGSFRMFTGGVAYEGLYCRVWGGTPADLILYGPTNKVTGKPRFDLRKAAKAGWVHVALVVDDVKKTATYYLDGQEHSVTTITGSAAPSGTGNFMVGRHGTTSTSNYDMDDFRLANRAVPVHEITQWAMAKLQTDSTEISVSGAGTQKMTVDATPAQANKLYWIFGSITGTQPKTVLGGVKIPLVVDPYTFSLVSFTNTPVFTNFRGVLDAQGKNLAPVSFNVPKTTPASAVGIKLFHAYLVYDAKDNYYDASNWVPTVLVK